MGHYETMGVPKNADSDQIKKAYRKLARDYHPDRNPGDPQAVHKFKEVQAAYEVLSNPSKRRDYDQSGYVHRRSYSPPPTPKPEPPKPKTKDDFKKERSDWDRRKFPTEQELQAIQCTFFSGGGTGRNIITQLKLTPEEMEKGCSKKILIKKRDFCMRCGGDGNDFLGKPCPRCQGEGQVLGWCPICRGDGSIAEVCVDCNGEGVKSWIIEEVNVVVSPGIQIGHQVLCLGVGESAPGKAPGNLRVVIV